MYIHNINKVRSTCYMNTYVCAVGKLALLYGNKSFHLVILIRAKHSELPP